MTPALPPLAVTTSKSPAVSKTRPATSRMSASSSMMRIRLRDIGKGSFAGHDHLVQQLNHAPLELLGENAALGKKLGRPERQPLALRRRRLHRRVHDHWHRSQPVMVLEPINDRESIHVRQNEIEDDQIGIRSLRELDGRFPACCVYDL